MRKHATFRDGHFAAGDAFQHAHALLQQLVAFHVDQVGARQTMLSDQDGFSIPFEIREQFGSLSLEGRDEFGTHVVILKCYSTCRKPTVLLRIDFAFITIGWVRTTAAIEEAR